MILFKTSIVFRSYGLTRYVLEFSQQHDSQIGHSFIKHSTVRVKMDDSCRHSVVRMSTDYWTCWLRFGELNYTGNDVVPIREASVACGAS
jgi:hypothetical protein